MRQLFTGINSKEQVSSFKYFQRGIWDDANEKDVTISKPKEKHLNDIDKLLRRFKFIDALELSLQRDNTKEIISLVEELYSKDLIDSILKQIK